MTLRMTVVGNELTENSLSEDRIRVTLKPYVADWNTDVVTLVLKPHEAKPYRLGRRVEISLNPE